MVEGGIESKGQDYKRNDDFKEIKADTWKYG